MSGAYCLEHRADLCEELVALRAAVAERDAALRDLYNGYGMYDWSYTEWREKHAAVLAKVTHGH